jgi:hypothetical protein
MCYKNNCMYIAYILFKNTASGFQEEEESVDLYRLISSWVHRRRYSTDVL